MDRGLRLRTPHRSTVGPAHPSRSHPGDEWRQLPPQAKPPQTKPILRTLNLPRRMRFGGEGPLPLRSPAPSPPKNPPLPSTLLVPFFSAQTGSFYSGLDRTVLSHTTSQLRSRRPERHAYGDTTPLALRGRLHQTEAERFDAWLRVFFWCPSRGVLRSKVCRAQTRISRSE